MPEQKKNYKVKSPVRTPEGVMSPGETIELTELDAKNLLADGILSESAPAKTEAKVGVSVKDSK